MNFLRSDHGLNEQFQRFCNMEFNDSSFDTKVEMSVEDSRALDIMERSVQLRDGHYQVALPWRNFPPWLPNNRSLAEHRLNQLKKLLLNDPKLHLKYSEFIDNLLKKDMLVRCPRTLSSTQNNLYGICRTTLFSIQINQKKSVLSLIVQRSFVEYH